MSEISGIDKKHAFLGSQSGFLGNPLDEEKYCPDGVGKYRHYDGGSIHWHPSYGAFETHGGIRDTWANSGWETGNLGYPISDECDWSGHDFWDMLPGNLVWTVPAVALAGCLAYLAVPRDLAKIGRWSKFERGYITWFERIKPPMASDIWIWKNR